MMIGQAVDVRSMGESMDAADWQELIEDAKNPDSAPCLEIE